MWSSDCLAESPTWLRLAQPFISLSRLVWRPLVCPTPTPAEDRTSSCAGVLTNIDPGVALTILDQALSVQVTYGAVMLSFLGVYLCALLHVWAYGI